MSKAVKPIPEHYRTLTPSLVVKGGKQAIEWYKKAFGAEELDVHTDPSGNMVMHAELRIGDSVLILSDEMNMPGQPPTFAAPSGPVPASLTLYSADIKKVWERAVAAGGKVRMPMEDMFWGDRWGQLQDPFGHVWNLSQRIEDLTPEELHKRGQEAMAKMMGDKK